MNFQNLMNTPLTIIVPVGVAVIALIVLAVVVYLRHRQTNVLRAGFGPEYLRMVEETGNRNVAEDRLEKRKIRVSKYPVHALSAEQRKRFAESWSRVQAQFVDSPYGALSEADDLLGELMRAKGYPVNDFEQKAADLSVDHPVVVQEYRAAHAVALRRDAPGTGTEDVRQAMLHYRALFDELANDTGATRAAAS